MLLKELIHLFLLHKSEKINLMNKFLALFIFSTVFVLTGCGLTPKQKEGVTTLAQASEEIGDFTATTLSDMRASTIEMNEKSIAIRKNDLGHERKILVGNVCGVHKECNDTFQQKYVACKKNKECNDHLIQLCKENTHCSTSYKEECEDDTDTEDEILACKEEKKVEFESLIIYGNNSKALISKICKGDKICEEEFPDRIFFGAFSTKNLTARISAAKALSSYGQLLKALVDDTQEVEIKQASDGLVASLNNVSTNFEDEINAAQFDSLGIAVAVIGKSIVEHKKAQAVKEIVPGTKDAVNTLCDLLIADFDSSEDGKLAAEYSNTIRILNGSVRKGLRNETNLQTREILLKTSELAYSNEAKLNTIVKQSKKTLEKLKEANSQLVEVLKDDKQDISRIKALVEQFQQLRNAVILIGNNQ